MTHEPGHTPLEHGHDHDHGHDGRGGRFGAALREVFAPHSHDASDSIDGPDHYMCDTVEQLFTHLSSLGAR
jgi:hypothetical protein